MASYFDDKEWHWLFDNAVDWDQLVSLYCPTFPSEHGLNSKEDFQSFCREILDTTGKWAAESIAPRARELDKVGPGVVRDGDVEFSEPLKQLFKEAAELGYYGLSVGPEYGGSHVPVSVSMMVFSQISRACQASSAQLTFFGAIADMLERFANKELVEKYVPGLASGELSGSMCLTEPGAGSDLGSLRTKAKHLGNDLYEITGSKIFITNGGGDMGLVLARVEGAPEGLAGISMFLVPKHMEGVEGLNFKVVKTEDKMGHHGCFTCEILYEKSKGWLIGEENKGFTLMLHLMNEARTGVGMQTLGGMEACLAYVRDYAETRKQFGRSLMDLPLYRRNFQEMETERDAYRALIMDTVVHFDTYQFLHKKKLRTGDLSKEEEKTYKEALKWTRRRTPLVKYYGSETYAAIAKKSVQALGGYGFMKEYDVERYLRDCYGALLYEGTSQIQSLMALKDMMKFVMKNPKRFFQTLVYGHPINKVFSGKGAALKDFGQVQFEFKKNFSSLLVKVMRPREKNIFNLESWTGEEQMETLMEHAEELCQCLSYLETLRVLGQHAEKDESRVDLFDRYKKLVQPRFAAIYSAWKLA